ncbi:WW domain-containing adapter protein with coiled-coil-like [Xenia sp. Carnegie-2017]|uniref:WW domain-containing adapter protein with coiled-coil-like n=1 Tax=Xenia sp. Carnegie-2017 TaxID=2897299 RepID=UPI001F04A432|nr:WW domain-containing adapter protein with coiled-coil-like [Xenia sp. Carnegie-2017]
MSARKYPRLSDGYHERSPYNQSSKHSSKPSNQQEGRSEKSSNVNGGSRSRNNSPRSRNSTMSPRSQRPSYSKVKELSRRASGTSPAERNHSLQKSSGDFKINSISTDESFPWSQHTSSSGKIYYYNYKTEKSQWEKPKEWLAREHQMEQEKKKRLEVSDKNSSSSRELSNKRDSYGCSVVGNKYNKEKNVHQDVKQTSQKTDNKSLLSHNHRRLSGLHDSRRLHQLHNSDNRRLSLQQHTPESKKSHYTHVGNSQSTAPIIKTSSANTTSVSTAVHRPDHVFAKSVTKASPSGSLHDVSPPRTPVTTAGQSKSPLVTVSPLISSHSPVVPQHSPVTKSSPRHATPQRLRTMTNRSSTSTPPPPPPPCFPHASPAHTLTPARPSETSPKTSAAKEGSSYNGFPQGFSKAQLHPLQQATLLQQAQFQGNSSRMMPSAKDSTQTNTQSPLHQMKPPNQHVPQQSHGLQPSQYVHQHSPNVPRQSQHVPQPSAPVIQRTTVASNQPILHPFPQTIILQDFVNGYNPELITHTLAWPGDIVEKQAQKSADDTVNLSILNCRLKADLVPLKFHQNLTRMRMDVGTKRIEFLRGQTEKLESSDAVS